MSEMQSKTYRLAACASGCAYNSTIGGDCPMCGGPLARPATVSRDQARAILLGDADGSYARGKAATLAWLATR